MLPSFPFSPFFAFCMSRNFAFCFCNKIAFISGGRDLFWLSTTYIQNHFTILKRWIYIWKWSCHYLCRRLIYKQQCKQNTRKKWKKAKKWTYASWINLIYLQIFSTFLPRDVLKQKITPFSQKNVFYWIKKSTCFRKK